MVIIIMCLFKANKINIEEFSNLIALMMHSLLL